MDEDRYTRITLRLPKELDEAIDAEAARTSKSKNAEIVARLQKSFEIPGVRGYESLREMPTAEELEQIMMRAVHVELRRAAAEQLELPGLPRRPDLFNQPEAALGEAKMDAAKPIESQVGRIIRRTSGAPKAIESKGPPPKSGSRSKQA